MLIKKLVIVCGTFLLLTSCAMNNMAVDNTPTGMGTRYLLGRGVQEDKQKAFYYFKQGAEDNDPFAQNELAFMYAAGVGTKRNNKAALFWYKKAANQGLASAQYNLGILYLHGLGTKKNKTKALYWFKRANANGFQPARAQLGSEK